MFSVVAFISCILSWRCFYKPIYFVEPKSELYSNKYLRIFYKYEFLSPIIRLGQGDWQQSLLCSTSNSAFDITVLLSQFVFFIYLVEQCYTQRGPSEISLLLVQACTFLFLYHRSKVSWTLILPSMFLSFHRARTCKVNRINKSFFATLPSHTVVAMPSLSPVSLSTIVVCNSPFGDSFTPFVFRQWRPALFRNGI